MKFATNFKNSTQRGFTLVEMLIVLGLFSFMMTLATSVLYSTQAINVKIQETQSILDNVNIAIDTMSREIRYGTDFRASNSIEDTNFLRRKSSRYDTTHGGKVLFFKPQDSENDDDRVAYYASTTPYGNVILKDEYTNGVRTRRYEITSNDVKIKSLIFYVNGANTSIVSDPNNEPNGIGDEDHIQPLITMTLSGETISSTFNASNTSQKASTTKFIIQSSVSARTLDK